jgi:hypothetical protein
MMALLASSNLTMKQSAAKEERRCAMAVHTPHPSLWRRVLSLPKTRLGWWSVGLAATFVVLFINETVFMPTTVVVPCRQVLLPFYGIAILVWTLWGRHRSDRSDPQP